MSTQGCGGETPELWNVSKYELTATIRELERHEEALAAERFVVQRRIAILRAERVARLRDAHFDPGPVAEALLRRLPELRRLLARPPLADE